MLSLMNSFINSGTVIYTGNGVHRQIRIDSLELYLAPVNHEYRAVNKKIVDQRFMPSKGGIVILKTMFG